MRQSALGQAIIDMLLATSSTGWLGKARSRSLSKARAILSRNEECFVRYHLHNAELFLPISHQLPVFRKHHPMYSDNIGRVAACVNRKYPAATMIDIGANVGDTAAIIRASCAAPILCIEGDAYYFGILKRNLESNVFHDIEACLAFVGAERRQISGGLRHEHGTAAYSADSDQSTSEIPLSQIVSMFGRFKSSKLLKIDTDGFDCQIVSAELDWLSEARPVVFIEYDPHLTGMQGFDASQIFPAMASIGYEAVVFWENTGEYLISAQLAEHDLIQDIHLYCSRSAGRRYLDLAFIHQEDSELVGQIRSTERSLWMQGTS